MHASLILTRVQPIATAPKVWHQGDPQILKNQNSRGAFVCEEFFAYQKVLAMLDHSPGTARSGTVFVQSGASYQAGEMTVSQLTLEHCTWRATSQAEEGCHQKKDVTIERNVLNGFYDRHPMQFNTLRRFTERTKLKSSRSRVHLDC